ncbi:hypothetical protein CJU90_6592 [Yarrowia sp. C11]|nr:hypothetical protein CJU90_6592 [Yarrowia sp. C11]KAG5358705.1 hypothetical protein CKK34_4969 [Yarrowia sp. E02]
MPFLSNLFGSKDGSAQSEQSRPPIKQDCNNFGSANAESTPMAVPQPNQPAGAQDIPQSVSESVSGSVYGSVAQSLPSQFGSAMSPTMSPKASALAAALAKQEEDHKQKLQQFRRTSQANAGTTPSSAASVPSGPGNSPNFSKVGSPGSPITADEAMNLSRAGGFQGRMRAGSNAAGGSGIAAQLASAGPQDIGMSPDGGSVKRKNSNKYQGFGLVAAYSNSGMN